VLWDRWKLDAAIDALSDQQGKPLGKDRGMIGEASMKFELP
jgi:hypothetical protein